MNSDTELFSAGRIVKVINLTLSMDLEKKNQKINVAIIF